MSDTQIVNIVDNLCKKLIEEHNVYAVVVSHPPNNVNFPPDSLSYACTFYQIPLISISADDSMLSEKSIHRTFLRTIPPDNYQVPVWADVLHDSEFMWSKVLVVFPDNYRGKNFYESMLNAFESVFVQVDSYVWYDEGVSIDDAKSYLKKLITSPYRVIFLYGKVQDCKAIFRAADFLNLTISGYVWFVPENCYPVAPSGTISTFLIGRNDVALQLKRAVYTLSHGLYGNINGTKPLKSCTETTPWDVGMKIYRSMITRHSINSNDDAEYDQRGDPINTKYNVVVKQKDGPVTIGYWSKDRTDSRLIIDPLDRLPDVEWMGGRKGSIPEGVLINNHLRVVAVEDPPFVFVVDSRNDCDNATHVVCYEMTPSGENITRCCYGYCIQLWISLSNSLNFTFDIYLSRDGQFGTSRSLTHDNFTVEYIWNGAVGEVVRGERDVIVASLTINNERAKVIDFTNPFKPQGLSIVVKRQKAGSSLSSFIQPFDQTLWLLILLSVHVVALILYLLDRFSPFAHSPSESAADDEEALNLSSALWFAYGVLLNSGIGGSPRSFAARVLGMVWAGFAMIIVASYTANLAAYLVLERPESEIAGINDARMRNPSEDYTYGTVTGSAVESYFRRKVEMTSMHQFMQKFNQPTQQHAINAIKNDSLHAFIWDSAQLDYETSKDCTLMTVGEIFHRSGLALGLKKNSPWTVRLSMQILEMREKGEMEKLDSKWIIVDTCPRMDNKPTTLDIDSMGGIFITVGIGIIMGTVIIFIERFYYNKFGDNSKKSTQTTSFTESDNAWVQQSSPNSDSLPNSVTKRTVSPNSNWGSSRSLHVQFKHPCATSYLDV